MPREWTEKHIIELIRKYGGNKVDTGDPQLMMPLLFHTTWPQFNEASLYERGSGRLVGKSHLGRSTKDATLPAIACKIVKKAVGCPDDVGLTYFQPNPITYPNGLGTQYPIFKFVFRDKFGTYVNITDNSGEGGGIKAHGFPNLGCVLYIFSPIVDGGFSTNSDVVSFTSYNGDSTLGPDRLYSNYNKLAFQSFVWSTNVVESGPIFLTPPNNYGEDSIMVIDSDDKVPDMNLRMFFDFYQFRDYGSVSFERGTALNYNITDVKPIPNSYTGVFDVSTNITKGDVPDCDINPKGIIEYGNVAYPSGLYVYNPEKWPFRDKLGGKQVGTVVDFGSVKMPRDSVLGIANYFYWVRIHIGRQYATYCLVSGGEGGSWTIVGADEPKELDYNIVNWTRHPDMIKIERG